MEINLNAETLELITGHFQRFEVLDLTSVLPQLDTPEKRNLASFQIGMARNVPILQEHGAVGWFWYPPETAAAYHLQHSTDKMQRLGQFVRFVTEALAVDEIHDVGANAGLFAAFCRSEVALHCYEPIPSLYPFITANAPSAELHPIAVGGESQAEVSFFVNSQSLQTSSLHRSAIIEDTATVEQITVPMERLDVIAGGKTVVKIDVQGAELQVLAGMSGCIDDCLALLVESTYLSLDTVTDVIPLARDAGFGWLYIFQGLLIVAFGAGAVVLWYPKDQQSPWRRTLLWAFAAVIVPANPRITAPELSAGSVTKLRTGSAAHSAALLPKSR